ncbi:MAG TPA: cation diffusion facilitator family transporter, partial [Thermoanaerobaculia bacterium]|nr:cation diffusion facilitator family transporter [Thermoanaerobaculia bacterium]
MAISRKLTIAAIANAVIVIAELVVGFASGSLSLIGDALHNLTDAAALVLTLIAVRLERRPATTAKTYGYQRAGVLAAFVNSAVLLALTGMVAKEAIERLRTPHAVETSAMFITAAIAMLINAATAMSLRRDGRSDVNIRSAMIHMIGDAVSSAGIIAGAILIRITGATQWDAIVSLFIGVLILWSSWGVLKESVNLLLEGTPSGIDTEEVSRAIGAIDGILGIHHLHIW